MRPVYLLFLPVLAACQPIIGEDASASAPGVTVPTGQTRVVEASATPGRVVIRLSDGSRCVSERPEGVLAGWSGTTSDCGYALPYTVTFKQGGHPARYRVEAPGVAVGASGVPGPRAEIFVTDVDGVRRLFVSPLSSSVRFEPAPAPAG